MSYNPKDSMITPMQWEHDGVKYAIGAWMTGISSHPLFTFVRLAGTRWVTAHSYSSELSKDIVERWGGQDVYINHHLEKWNDHFKEEKPRDPFLVSFGDYLGEHVTFDGKLLKLAPFVNPGQPSR